MNFCIPYTLTLAAVGDKSRFVTEFDCVLDVEFDSPEDWTIEAVDFPKSGNSPEFSVTATSDPDLWRLMERAFDHSEMRIANAVTRWAAEEAADRVADRADYEREIRMEREQ